MTRAYRVKGVVTPQRAVLCYWIIPITSTAACTLDTILTFHSILSDRFRLFRGRAQPLLSMTASVKQHTRKEPTIVQGDAPHSPPFGVTRRRSQMSNILESADQCAKPDEKCLLVKESVLG